MFLILLDWGFTEKELQIGGFDFGEGWRRDAETLVR
jgi:hypothetical protein